jgi:Cu+-exporting ATPase
LAWAAAAELGSEHPLGKAIVRKAEQQKLSLHRLVRFEALRGKGVVATVAHHSNGQVAEQTVLVGSRSLMDGSGVSARLMEDEMQRLESEGKTAVLVAVDGAFLGILAIADTLKEDAALVIRELNSMELETVMLTGDNERTAQAIAQQVGIQRVLAEVLPEDKLDEIRRLQRRLATEGKGLVAMIGDGINDAPALTQADVGIALGTGTDIAIEAADITLVRGDLSGVISAVKLSRATFRKVEQGLFWAFFYNVVMIPLAVLGLMHPVLAEIAMATSSISVVTNANLLRRTHIRPDYEDG